MNIPGFTAEASCYEAKEQYRMMWSGFQASAAIHPQFVRCDFECLTNCYSDCLDLVGRARAACLRACRQECCHQTLFPPRL